MSRAAPLLAALGLGCALHPVAETPEPRVAADAWSLALPAAARDPQTAWWTTLGDSALERLIERALDANLGLEAARARIVPAEALARQSRSPLGPQLDAVAGGALARTREEGGSEEWSAGGALAWELDLWGRLRSAADAQRAELEATRADRDAARLLLTSRVAETWYGVVEQQLQLALLAEQRELASTLVTLTELRFPRSL